MTVSASPLPARLTVLLLLPLALLRRSVALPSARLQAVRDVLAAEGEVHHHQHVASDTSASERERSHELGLLAKPKEAGWFGSFDQMESTYTAGGVDANLKLNPEARVANGVEFGFKNPMVQEKNLKEPKWFAVTPSAGANDAWQTFYPPVPASIVGNRNIKNNPWRNTPQGWVQDYIPSPYTGVYSSGSGPNPADWFENGINQLDGLGRIRLPDKDDPRRLLATGGGPAWQERAVNTTLTCAEIGCTASAMLQAFDPATEEAQFCAMSVGMHATDFDQDYSREVVENWNVNNFLVTNQCEPQAHACNEAEWRPLYPCITDFPADMLLEGKGLLNISGTLSDFVDECPYEGNLLSGVVWVTCMVRPIVTTTTTTTPDPLQRTPPEIFVTAPLQCATAGCTANTLIRLNPMIAMIGGDCLMNISVLQTDYDQSLGQSEVIEFIKLRGQTENISTNVAPGLNPCNSEDQGTPISDEEKVFNVVQNVNVTEQVLTVPVGALVITGKISAYVDECATPAGYLLDGLVSVRCTPPATISAAGSATPAPAPAA